MLVPAMIGAGVGAIGGAAMGKNPFKTALLGAGVGATGGATGLFGGGAAAGAGTTAGTLGVGAGEGLIGGANLTGAGIASGTGAGATGGFGSLLSGLRGVETAPVSFGTGGYASGITSSMPAGLEGMTYQQAIGNAPMSGVGYTNPASQEIGSSLATTAGGKGTSLSIMDKAGNYISNLPSNTMDWAKNNPITATKTALDLTTPSPDAAIQDRSMPIRQGNPNAEFAPNFNVDRSSTLSNVQPTLLPQQDNKIGLLNILKTRIPLTDEEKARLARLGQQVY